MFLKEILLYFLHQDFPTVLSCLVFPSASLNHWRLKRRHPVLQPFLCPLLPGPRPIQEQTHIFPKSSFCCWYTEEPFLLLFSSLTRANSVWSSAFLTTSLHVQIMLYIPHGSPVHDSTFSMPLFFMFEFSQELLVHPSSPPATFTSLSDHQDKPFLSLRSSTVILQVLRSLWKKLLLR